MDDLLAEFLTETNEALEVTDIELVKLEQEPDNPDILGNIFRLVHTIKGTSGFLGLPRLETVAHAGEDVLGKIRDGEIEVSPDVITLVLEALDRIKEIVQGLGELETEPEGDDSEIVARLRETAANAKAPAAKAAPAAADPAKSELDDIKANELAELEAAFNAAPGPGQFLFEFKISRRIIQNGVDHHPTATASAIRGNDDGLVAKFRPDQGDGFFHRRRTKGFKTQPR
jgi:two-component system chemotaxis sensor kinase CheA